MILRVASQTPSQALINFYWIFLAAGFFKFRKVCKWQPWKSVGIILADDPLNIYSTCLKFGIFNWPKEFKVHTLFCDFGGYNTIIIRWSGCRVQVCAKSLLVAWQSLQKAVPERNQRFWAKKKQGQALGAELWHSFGCWTGKHKHRALVGSSCCWQLQARFMKGCCHFCDTDPVQESGKFRWIKTLGSDNYLFFTCEVHFQMKETRTYYRPMQSASIRSIFQACPGLWV